MTADLPPRAVHIAAGLVGAVHDQDPAMVEHWLREAGPHYHACDMRELHAVVVALAAMVDDTKTMGELLEWVDRGDVLEWRANLTQAECIAHHSAWTRGERDEATRDGEREYQKRRKQRDRAGQVAA